MSELRKADIGKMYFITLTTAGWIDVFNRKEYVDEIVSDIRFCQENKGLLLFCYVIMSSHLHMIAASNSHRLGDIMRDLKSYSATRLLSIINEHPGESRKEWMQYLFRYFGKGVGQERQFWLETPVKLTTLGRGKLTTWGRSKLTTLGRGKLTT